MKALQKAQKALSYAPYESLLVTDPLDLFYLLGLEFSLGTLWLTKESALLFVDGRYQEVASQSGVEVKPLVEFEGFLSTLKGECAFDQDHISYGHFLSLQKKKRELVSILSPIKELRERKEPFEIQKIKVAAELCMDGMQYLIETLEEGVSEKEMAHKLDIFWKSRGGERFSFEPIIAFGANSSKPHYRSSEKRLVQGEVVLLDMGVVVDHYHSDMTRLFAFGKVDPELQKIYQIVYQAKEHAKKGCKIGASFEEIDSLAREYIVSQGYGDKFIHSLGHGIGLQTHERPYFRKGYEGRLQKGHVMTIEPGIYLPGVGGVRLEDMVLIEEEGPINLTPRFDSAEIVVLQK